MRHPVNVLTTRWSAACSGESAVMSGAGVWPLLAYLASAAAGPGRAELEDAVGVPARHAAQAAADVLTTVQGPAVRSAIGLWSARDLPLRPSWLAALPAGLRGELTGDPVVDGKALDSWAAERTGGLVPAMPIAVSEDTLLVPAAALAVATRWLRPFLEGAGEFPDGPWAGRELAVLYRRTAVLDRLRVAATPVGPLTMLRVMGTGGVDVHLVLGVRDEPGEVLPAAIRVLDDGAQFLPLEEGPGVSVAYVRATEPGDRLDVTVPRFTVASTHDLLRLPEVFGLATVSDMSHGHPGISPEPLAVGQAAQAAVAVFSATGFESASVTAFEAVAGGAPPPEPYRIKRVQAVYGRPFGFLAVERRGGTVLTAGWVADPNREPRWQAREMRLATWNVNSVKARLPRLLDWLAEVKPDIVCLQETKCPAEAFPSAEVSALGYAAAAHGDGRWNGVALLSRLGLDDVTLSFPGEPGFAELDGVGAARPEARAIGATCGGLHVWSVYAPNGRTVDSPHYAYKLAWFAALRDALAPEIAAGPLVVCGDFNVAPTDADVWDPALFVGSTHVTPAEREALAGLRALGLHDVVPTPMKGPHPFTYWDYRAGMFHKNMGMRIDLVYATADVTGRVRSAYVDREARKGKTPSDHAPIVIDLDPLTL